MTGQGCDQVYANAAASLSTLTLGQLFTPEQWKALSGLIGNAKVPEIRLNGTFDASYWIIDTGATHHIIIESSWLFDTQNLNARLVYEW